MALLSLARHAGSLHVTPARRMSRLLIACPCCCLRSAGVLAGSFDSLVLPSAFNLAPGFARCAARLAKSGHPYSPSSCQAYSLHVLAHPKYQPSPRKPMPPNRLAWPYFSHSRAPVRYWDALIALPHTSASRLTSGVWLKCSAAARPDPSRRVFSAASCLRRRSSQLRTRAGSFDFAVFVSGFNVAPPLVLSPAEGSSARHLASLFAFRGAALPGSRRQTFTWLFLSCGRVCPFFPMPPNPAP